MEARWAITWVELGEGDMEVEVDMAGEAEEGVGEVSMEEAWVAAAMSGTRAV